MIEEWKDILGYEDHYQVSSFGNVRSLNKWVKNRYSIRLVKGKILKPAIGNSGYYYVNLSIESTGSSKDVHRLVALEFYGHENSHLTVNHEDGNKLNNNLDNLKFMSTGDNTRHAINVLGRKPNRDHFGEKNPMFGKKHTQDTKDKISKKLKKCV